jgi:hypothetical protein
MVLERKIAHKSMYVSLTVTEVSHVGDGRCMGNGLDREDNLHCRTIGM